jgi:hypothetical protein
VGFAVASGAALAVGILIKLFVVVALVPVALYLAAPIFPLWLGADGRPRLPAWEALRARLRTVAPDLGWLAVGLFGAALLVLLPLASEEAGGVAGLVGGAIGIVFGLLLARLPER